MIRKEGKRYVVRSKAGRRLGSHATRRGAQSQLAAVEISKRRRGK